MSYVELSMKCPQCGNRARNDFSTRDNASTVLCHFCGYTSYCGPDKDGKWVDETKPGFGAISVQGDHGGVINHYQTEADFRSSVETMEAAMAPGTWGRATRFNLESGKIEVVKEVAIAGFTVPEFLDLALAGDLDVG